MWGQTELRGARVRAGGTAAIAPLSGHSGAVCSGAILPVLTPPPQSQF